MKLIGVLITAVVATAVLGGWHLQENPPIQSWIAVPKAAQGSLVEIGAAAADIASVVFNGTKAGYESVRSKVLGDEVAGLPAKDDSSEHPEEGSAGASKTASVEHADSDQAEGNSVKLSDQQLKEFGIEVGVAATGPIAEQIERPAEVKFDGERLTHVLPRVSGVVTEVATKQGEEVKKEQFLASLSSRELAELKAAYLADFERRGLARETFEREQRLWEKRISSEKNYLEAKTAMAEAEIALRVSTQKLRALGFSQDHIEGLKQSDAGDLTKYDILAPNAGTVIERHINLGEAVANDDEVFVIADASTVWVDVTVYPSDMAAVRSGQSIRVDLGDGNPILGRISYVSPNVSEETRTAIARAEIQTDGRLKPGMFVRAAIDVGAEQAQVRLPKSALQNYASDSVVFVRDGDVFAPRAVRIGRDNAQFVEIIAGLKIGETYVAEGAFAVKSLIQKSQMGEGHAH